MNKMDINSYFTLLREMVKIHPFWNFSGYNKIAMDNHLFYEQVHFRPIVSKYITDTIFDKNSSSYGSFVTNNNIGKHLDKLLKEIKIEEKKWL